jgi:serine/threonine-protein kinase RsbW
MFDIVQKAGGLELYFSATLKNIDQADKETRKYLSLIGKDEHAFEVLLVMREALHNAVERGCALDHRKNVRYALGLKRDNLTMEVEDEGDGFDWRSIMKRVPEPESDHNRGLAIMQRCSDEIKYNEKGNVVVLTINLAGSLSALEALPPGRTPIF